MDLILWRHADAMEGPDDLKRPLTARGEKQARQMAGWLRQYGPSSLRLVVSPALRTRQTAKALELPFEINRQLAPNASASDLLAASGWPDARGAVVLVGHQPALGQLAALLLAGEEAPWTIKKGALWWFSNRVRAGEAQTVLRAAIGPELL